jgi:phosphonate metabolism protein (transferase hexapeptide repeat family)
MPYIEFFGEKPQSSGKKMLSEEPSIHPTSRVSKCEIGAYTSIGAGCSMRESSLGDYSYLAGEVSIVWTDIGKFCSIASHTRMNPGNHPTWRVTTSHCTYRRAQYGFDTEDDHEFFAWRKAHRCEVGHDVWMGHGTILTAGCKVGIGACIGAGSVITKDVPPFAIYGGVPAKLIKYRFDPRTIEQLMRIAYWDWDHETIKARFHDLLNVHTFIEKYGI